MGHRAIKILVAEANDLLGHALADVLSETAAGSSVHLVRTLPDALAYVAVFHYQLIVVDAWIARGPVEHFVRELVAVAPGSVVVVIATAVDADFERRALAAGAAACIKKEDMIAHASAIVDLATATA